MDEIPSGPEEETTLELVGRIQDGDKEAWESLYRRYHDPLLLAVRLRLGQGLRIHLQSEDVFQSVALEALTALRGFEYRGPGSLNRFLQQLVLNKIRDRADTFGAQKRAGAVPLTPALAEGIADRTTSPTGPNYLDGGRFVRLERCLAELPDDQREVVLLRKIEGHSSQEVAALLGKSDASVRKAFSRGLARLTAQMLAGEDDD